ncbi:MAG: ornithine carbamoyltransferase [Candidatus Omnitrophica bacterium]|nr:ornithine carbamoyltransferase [Candidatus Omnitrophota bacterium]
MKPGKGLMKRDFISLKDFSSGEISNLLSLAKQLKSNPRHGCDFLKGKSVALIFQKPSNRTRVSFETGIFQLGGNAIYLAPDDISLGKREPTADIAKTLSRYVDGIVARVFSHHDLLDLAKYATVPVINALSNLSHPCQVLADILTVQEKFGKLKGIKFAYIGDGNNMTNSLLMAGAKTGMAISVATPKGYEPDRGYVKAAEDAAKTTGAKIVLTHDPREAVKGAQVIYTDTWVSMGQEDEKTQRLKDFEGYQIDEKLASIADKNYIFMHCLPAHRGQEVTADVIDGPHSVIFDEAENRLHAQKAVMIYLHTFKHQ